MFICMSKHATDKCTTEIRKRSPNLVFTENVSVTGSMVFEKWTCKISRFYKNVYVATQPVSATILIYRTDIHIPIYLPKVISSYIVYSVHLFVAWWSPKSYPIKKNWTAGCSFTNNLITSTVRLLRENLKPRPSCIMQGLSLRFSRNDLTLDY